METKFLDTKETKKFSKLQLKAIINFYNLKNNIQDYKKLSKEELMNELNKHLFYIDNVLYQKQIPRIDWNVDNMKTYKRNYKKSVII